MSKKDWKDLVFKKVNEKYGEMKEEDRTKLDKLLEAHWSLNQERSAYVLSYLGEMFVGIGIGATIDLSAILPKTAIMAVLGRSTFMSLGYMAGGFLSASVLKKVLPPLQKFEETQLNGLFKKADGVAEFLKIVEAINNDVKLALEKQKQASLISAAGVFGGNLATAAFFASKGNAAGMVYRSAQGMPTLFSFYAPKPFTGQARPFSVPTTWEKQHLQDDRQREAELRQRRPS